MEATVVAVEEKLKFDPAFCLAQTPHKKPYKRRLKGNESQEEKRNREEKEKREAEEAKTSYDCMDRIIIGLNTNNYDQIKTEIKSGALVGRDATLAAILVSHPFSPLSEEQQIDLVTTLINECGAGKGRDAFIKTPIFFNQEETKSFKETLEKELDLNDILKEYKELVINLSKQPFDSEVFAHGCTLVMAMIERGVKENIVLAVMGKLETGPLARGVEYSISGQMEVDKKISTVRRLLKVAQKLGYSTVFKHLEEKEIELTQKIKSDLKQEEEEEKEKTEEEKQIAQNMAQHNLEGSAISFFNAGCITTFKNQEGEIGIIFGAEGRKKENLEYKTPGGIVTDKEKEKIYTTISNQIIAEQHEELVLKAAISDKEFKATGKVFSSLEISGGKYSYYMTRKQVDGALQLTFDRNNTKSMNVFAEYQIDLSDQQPDTDIASLFLAGSDLQKKNVVDGERGVYVVYPKCIVQEENGKFVLIGKDEQGFKMKFPSNALAIENMLGTQILSREEYERQKAKEQPKNIVIEEVKEQQQPAPKVQVVEEEQTPEEKKQQSHKLNLSWVPGKKQEAVDEKQSPSIKKPIDYSFEMMCHVNNFIGTLSSKIEDDDQFMQNEQTHSLLEHLKSTLDSHSRHIERKAIISSIPRIAEEIAEVIKEKHSGSTLKKKSIITLMKNVLQQRSKSQPPRPSQKQKPPRTNSF